MTGAGRSFLAIGECMVEMAPAERGLYAMGYAGDSFNTAWYARRLLPPDWRVGYCSAVGDDPLSETMLAFMEAEGVGTDAVARLPGLTVGLYMIRLERGERSFAYWRGQSAARRLADDPDRLAAVVEGHDLIHFTGITLAILPPEGRARLVSALATVRRAGTTIAFDTNLRPRLWESAETMAEGIALGASVADIVLPSLDEEAVLSGDASPEATLARYRAAGAHTVALKNGGGPCHLWSAEEGTLSLAPPPVADILDSTAAGDSFGAAFLAARMTGASLEEAGERAMALAAKVIGRRGALARDLFALDTG